MLLSAFLAVSVGFVWGFFSIPIVASHEPNLLFCRRGLLGADIRQHRPPSISCIFHSSLCIALFTPFLGFLGSSWNYSCQH